MARVKLSNARAEESREYVNEHLLAVLMSSFRNYNGETIESDRREESQKALRAEFDVLWSNYESALLGSGQDKRSAPVQSAFKELISLSEKIVPTDAEISLLFSMIRTISQRCLGVYARHRGLDSEDIAVSSFERWLKYKHNFEPLKRSEFSGARVNAFSYMTQLIKNTIFEASKKARREEEIAERLAEEWQILNESVSSRNDSKSSQNNGPTASQAIDEKEDEEIIHYLMTEIPSFSNLSDFLNNTIKKYNLKPNVVIEIIEAYQLIPVFKATLLKNKWKF